jgi:hypothetical protein
MRHARAGLDNAPSLPGDLDPRLIFCAPPARRGMTFGMDAGVANVRHPRSRAARGYRESTHACPADVRGWIPAFAGMTVGVKVSGDQLGHSPRPSPRLRGEGERCGTPVPGWTTHPRCPVTWIPALTLARRRHDAGMTFGMDAGVPNVRHPRSRAARGYRESTHARPADVRGWIPAFAGMTFGGEGLRPQLASCPARTKSGLNCGGHPGHQAARVRVLSESCLSPPLPAVSSYAGRWLATGRGVYTVLPVARIGARKVELTDGSRSGRPGSHPFPARRQQWRRTGDCLMRLKVDGAPMRRTPKRDLGQKSPTRVPEGNPRAVRPWSPQGFPRRPARVSWSAAMRSAVADEAPAYPSHLRSHGRGGTARA